MATTKRKTGRQNYDWDSIKIDYVTSDLSLRKIAKKYGIREQAVFLKSKADNWVAARQDYRAKSNAKAIAKCEDNRAKKIAKLMETSDKMLQHINRAVEDMEQFNKYIVTEAQSDGTTEVIEKTFDKADARAIRDIASSLKTIAELMGYQAPAQIEKQKLDRERFEWEKAQAEKKAEAEKIDNDITIRIEGFCDEWSK